MTPTAARPTEVTPESALVLRLAGHHLDAHVDPTAAVAATGLQDYPPGWAAVALHARAHGEPPAGSTVTVNAMRGAPWVVPAADVDVFTRALVPEDEAGLRALVGSQTAREAEEAGFGVRDALERVADAARAGLADGPLGRDDFHQAMRERLPMGLLPWCRGCNSHHVRPGLWRALGPLGVTMMPARATYALAGPPSMPIERARAELARRFVAAFGPATHSQLAAWAQTAPSHAKALFALVFDELVPVRLSGRRAFLLRTDVERLDDPPAARGVRLLGGYDPWVAQPDRETLVGGDAQLRKRLSPAVGRPGIVLVDGVLAGLWRSRAAGRALVIQVDWRVAPADIDEEAEAVARLRGRDGARVGPWRG